VNIKSYKYPVAIAAGFLMFIFLLVVLLRFQTQQIEQTVSMRSLTGYVQTPIGGRPGTSDLLRPRLNELGIERAPVLEQAITQHHLGWNIYTGYEQIRAQGDTQLKTALKTYGRFILPRTPLQTGIKFDWYRLGGAYPVRLWWGDLYEMAPAIELVLLDFGYRFKTPLMASGRVYRHVGVRIGFTLKHRVNNQWTTRAYFFSIPRLGRLSILTDTFFTQKTAIIFKDSQPLPNHLFLEAKTESILQRQVSPVGAQGIAPQLIIPLKGLSKSKSLDW
jgi:hypothetical protein